MQLSSREGSEVWKVLNRATSDFAVMRIFKEPNPTYKILKENPHPPIAKILYLAADETETVVIRKYIHGESLMVSALRLNFCSVKITAAGKSAR